MKKFTVLMFVIFVAGVFAQAGAQQVIASSGGYYVGENLTLSWTVGEPVIETFSGTSVILTQGFQQPYSFYLSQILNIPAGWSGVSSYVDPLNKGVEGIFSGYVPDFILLASMNEIYFPSQGINTLGNWNYETGFKIKAENAFDVTLTGTKIASPTVELNSGWNLIPVLTSCGAGVDEVFSGINGVNIVKEVAGVKIYWPAYEINTLVELVPGRSYFVMMANPADFTYPACSKSAQQVIYPVENQQFNPWNEQRFTSASHAIAFPADVIGSSSLLIGDIIGAFTPAGLCAGSAEITNPGKNMALVAFADDEITGTQDGFLYGEILQYKVFRPGTGEELNLVVDYDLTLPNQGMFASQGLSAVKSVKIFGGESSGQITAEVFPNPSNGIFNLSMNYWPENMKVELMDAAGQTIKQLEAGQRQNGSSLELNLSFLPDGVYFLKLMDQKFIQTKKIVIH